MLKNIVIIISFLILALNAFVQPVLAYEVTDFGSCLNPQVSANQVNTGSDHGVVGYSGVAFSGTDSIYLLSSNNVMQCLCTDNGQGYQTSWVSANNYSSSEIPNFQSEGWNYFEDASNWGLQGAYLAKTEKYMCSGVTPTPMCSETPTPTLTPTPTGTLTPTPTSTPGPTNTPTPGPTNTPTPGPASQATTATLASTGNLMFIYGIVVVGFFSLIVGLILKKFSR
jgi:hypothetical protein